METSGAIAVLAAQLASAPSRIATDPSGLLSDLQTAQVQLDRAGQMVPENVRAAVSQIATQATSSSRQKTASPARRGS